MAGGFTMAFAAPARGIRFAALLAALLLASCGAGGGGTGAYTTITFDNVDLSGVVVEVDFDFFDASGLPNRVESVQIDPFESMTFEFEQGESDEFVSVELTWSDATTTTIPLLFVSGGDFTYPVARP